VYLDDRDPAFGEEMRLVPADQPAPEHDGHVRRQPLAVGERPPARVDGEARRLELRDEPGLARCQHEDTPAVALHGGIFPAPSSFKAWVMGTRSGMRVEALDHVALWVEDRDALADFLTERLGMHVIERTDAFTLVGADARRGKLTLFAAEGPRDRGVLAHIAIRVPTGAADELPSAPASVPLVAVETEGAPYDIDHVAFRVPDPGAAFSELATLGFAVEGGRLKVGDAYADLEPGDPGETERPLLNHLGLLVESVDEHIAEARRRGLDIADVVDAANTYALFLWGPSGIKLEYVEHKPTFALA
jgi:catechol 2,3-dioxygenase-like lactoylglutathione lyase family enzyme